MRSHSRQQAARGRLIRPRTISGQLARLLAVSLVLVLALLGLTMAGQISAYRRSGETVDAVAVALSAQDLVHHLQRERGLSNGLLGSDARLTQSDASQRQAADVAQSVANQRVATDGALRAVSGIVAAEPPGASEVRSALGHLATLPSVRSQVDTRTVSRQAAFQFYSDAIDALNRLALGLDQARDPVVRHGLQALYALGDAKEFTARERGFLNGVFAAGEFGAGEYVQFLDIRAARTAALTQFDRNATAEQQQRLDAAMSGENAARASQFENIAIASLAGPLVESVDPATWWARMTEVIDQQRVVQQNVGDDVRDRAADLRRDAALLLAAFTLAALVAVAVEVMLVIASRRAIVRPLAQLAAEADDVASSRLPGVIAAWHQGDEQPEPPAAVRTPQGASTEIAAVASALDRVQTTAFDLASEQALVRRNTTESMANLARRNQNLVRRQLGLISEFEREELDPKALSNLFELDHLATRMRRNAESLLVLVGEASPRRWAEPIALTDVIRAGLSEVDDYRRVVLRRVDDVAVAGAVVSELAHALAELIENGLAFSPPDLEVEVYGRKVAGGYLLAVVDHGVGMSAEALAEANARLRGEQDFIVASTRYLGHYVVGRLAGRLGIEVELNTSPVSGIVARLLLPPSVLVDPNARPVEGTRNGWAEPVRDTTPVAGLGSAEDTAPARNGTVQPGDGDMGSLASRIDAGHGHGGPASLGSDRAALETRNGATHGRDDGDRARTGVAHADTGSAESMNGHGGANRPVNGFGAPRHSADSRADAGGSTTPDDGVYARFVSGAASPVDHAGPVDRNGSADTSTVRQMPNGRRDTVSPNGSGAPRGPRPVAGPIPRGDDMGRPAVEHAAGSGQPVEHTRNGLVKRSKRAKITGSPDRPRSEITQKLPPVVERTPDQTRNMLSSFRIGHERGADTTLPDPTH
ncbi:sensor histidine kinase [Nocardia camponoti]|uniref:sensor histidine kinase n=1 Tax=Nocardia camponoti TaxID=1616106 RepID=UPI001E58C0B6|nr:nitrate- and nitrite sensing domain-containing protein [Nocardia camponoti]